MTEAFRLPCIHQLSMRNRPILAPGVACRCFYCFQAFPAETIGHWTDDGETALCPNCGIDAVLPTLVDPLSDELIQAMHNTYFGRSTRISSREEWDAIVAERRARGAAVGGA